MRVFEWRKLVIVGSLETSSPTQKLLHFSQVRILCPSVSSYSQRRQMMVSLCKPLFSLRSCASKARLSERSIVCWTGWGGEDAKKSWRGIWPKTLMELIRVHAHFLQVKISVILMLFFFEIFLDQRIYAYVYTIVVYGSAAWAAVHTARPVITAGLHAMKCYFIIVYIYISSSYVASHARNDIE
jgi:hypothetical protein